MNAFNLTVIAFASVITAALFVGPAVAQDRAPAAQTVHCVASGPAETTCVVSFPRTVHHAAKA